jgi:hypothetical protein
MKIKLIKNSLFSFSVSSVKEGMYLNTKDFINEIKTTLNKKLNYVI